MYLLRMTILDQWFLNIYTSNFSNYPLIFFLLASSFCPEPKHEAQLRRNINMNVNTHTYAHMQLGFLTDNLWIWYVLVLKICASKNVGYMLAKEGEKKANVMVGASANGSECHRRVPEVFTALVFVIFLEFALIPQRPPKSNLRIIVPKHSL